MIALDAYDYTILHLLQLDGRERMDVIALQTGLSVATVQRRIKALKAEGVIDRETALIRPDLLGFGMTFLVMVELERERLVELDAFREQILAERQVQQCYYVTGDFDFVLIVLTQDVERFKLLTHRLFFDNPNVKRFRTSLVMDRTKVSLTVPFEALPVDASIQSNAVEPVPIRRAQAFEPGKRSGAAHQKTQGRNTE